MKRILLALCFCFSACISAPVAPVIPTDPCNDKKYEGWQREKKCEQMRWRIHTGQGVRASVVLK